MREVVTMDLFEGQEPVVWVGHGETYQRWWGQDLCELVGGLTKRNEPWGRVRWWEEGVVIDRRSTFLNAQDLCCAGRGAVLAGWPTDSPAKGLEGLIPLCWCAVGVWEGVVGRLEEGTISFTQKRLIPEYNTIKLWWGEAVRYGNHGCGSP